MLKMVLGAGSIVALRQSILELYKRMKALTAPGAPMLTTHEIATQTLAVERQSMAYVGRLGTVDVIIVKDNRGGMRCALVPAGQALSATLEAKVSACAVDGNSILLSTIRSQASVALEKRTADSLPQSSLWTTDAKQIHSHGSVLQIVDSEATGNLQVVAVNVQTDHGRTLTPAIAVETLSIGDVVDVCQYRVQQIDGSAHRIDDTMFIVARKRKHNNPLKL